jgi:hypothetical protein
LLEELYDYVDGGEAGTLAGGARHDPLAFLEDRGEARQADPFSLSADNQTIMKFAQSTCLGAANKMVAHVGQKNDSNLIEVGRFFAAMTELCPALQKCVEAPQAVAEGSGDHPAARGLTYQESIL